VKRWGWIAVILYVVLLVGGLASLPVARSRAIAYMGSTPERKAWEGWRDEVRRQDDAGGSVKRRVPSSVEPPTLVLLRDHFVTCVMGGFLLTTLLYWSTVFFIRGAIFGPKFQINTADRE
jgi:hypothetical protein